MRASHHACRPASTCILDASEVACVRLPAAGSDGRGASLRGLLGRQGAETADGVTSADTRLRPAALRRPRRPSRPRRPLSSQARVRSAAAATFHARLRAREQRPGATPTGGARLRARAARCRRRRRSLAVLGDFSVTFERTVRDPACDDFVQVARTRTVVGQRVAIYLDDRGARPRGTTAQATSTRVGDLFDDHLYPIDTTAFGSESDLDANESRHRAAHRTG